MNTFLKNRGTKFISHAGQLVAIPYHCIKLVSMKKLFPFLLWAAFAQSLSAQILKSSTANNGFGPAFTKVVQDYRQNFGGIQGDAIEAQPGTQAFKSTICLPGAQHCFITRYNSQQDKSASWQAILYSGDSYEEALKAYKAALKQIKHTAIPGIENGTVNFTGNVQQADENVRFAATTFRLKTADKFYQELATDVALSGSMYSWEVQVNVYKKRADTDGDSE
jgi:hypothetical protein